MSKRVVMTVLLTALMLCGLILVSSVNFANAQTGTEVIGILNSDTSWTKANNPYTLMGPVAVNAGVTLTIESGSTINLDNYYIQVNGTLTSIGSSSSLIQFNGGLLRFTPLSVEWNDQAGAGCIVQYASFNLTSISASVAIKLDNDVLSGGVEVGDNSIISNSNISEAVTAGNFCWFTNNQVNSSVTAGNSSTITNNNIHAGITAGEGSSILDNTVVGGVVCSGSTSVISDNNIQGGQVTGGSITGNTISSVISTYTDMDGDTLSYFPNVHVTGNVVSNNNITNGTVHATQIVTNNVILSGTYVDSFRVFGGWADYIESSPAITTTGSPTISGNTITGGGTYTGPSFLAHPQTLFQQST
jgi:NDP-sugar pyrophosphorylase family protein